MITTTTHTEQHSPQGQRGLASQAPAPLDNRALATQAGATEEKPMDLCNLLDDSRWTVADQVVLCDVCHSPAAATPDGNANLCPDCSEHTEVLTGPGGTVLLVS